MISDISDTLPEPSPEPSPELRTAAVDTERHVAAGGWDQPVRLFALVNTGELLRAEPSLYDELSDHGPDSLTAIEQDDLPPGDLEEMLGSIVWPPEVDGAAIAVERIVVPPEAEAGLPEDADEAMSYLMTHPDRRDVRLLVAVERRGPGICLLRQRDHDSDDQVAIGHDIATGLLDALRSTLG